MRKPEREADARVFPGYGGLQSAPPLSEWEDWREYDAKAWPRRVEKRYWLIPTTCFNCESGCGLVAFVDQETGRVRKLEGHPLHAGSRGRNCAKGPATVSQLTNPDRILYPMRRTGARGEGKFQRVTWDEVLDDLAGRIRKAVLENRRDEVIYHVGRPGEDLFTERVVSAWGVDGHNSHTNVCSAGARLGYAAWMGIDRPAPDNANARFMLLFSAHLESGHYFNPHAQRIIEAQQAGAKICVVDPRLSNSASKADYWLTPHPGTEAGLLLAMANWLLQQDAVNHAFLERWVNWQEFVTATGYLDRLVAEGFLKQRPEPTFAGFIQALKELYAPYTPAWAEAETQVPAEQIIAVAKEIARAGTAFASHIWRNAAAGHLGGWMVARNLMFLNVLVGAVGTPGGLLPNAWAKFVPKPFNEPPAVRFWNELNWPREYPLAHMEMSFLLPHLQRKRQKRIDVYFTRVYNPVWTNPDGFSWIEMLSDENRIGLTVALTPTWSETAQYADYVLPMGLGPERHDLVSYETHAAQWLTFRQPVLRVAREKQGDPVSRTYEANPGEVWEENEFWIELSWRIDPDGSLGVRKYFESPYRPGQRITIDEYYRWIFENSVPGLPARAEQEGLSPLAYMRKVGTFEVTQDVYREQERPVAPELLERAVVHDGALWLDERPERINLRPYPGPFRDEAGRFRVGILRDGQALQGFPTPSGLLEFFSTTLLEWGWPEYAVPIYPRTAAERERMPHITSQVHPSRIRREEGEYVLLPTFRLPTLIHTRTNGAKWLYEISHNNPVWIHPDDAGRLGVVTGDLVRVETETGHFVDRCWVTEAIRPGIVACSHHLGRWRLWEDGGSDRWNSALVRLTHESGHWRMQQVHGTTPFKSDDPDSSRIWWSEGGVHQNLIFPVQPDPLSGQHCWHQKIRVRKAAPGDRYGDLAVDANKSKEVFERWLKLTRPAPGPGGLRRPLWLLRPLKPHPDAYRLEATDTAQH